MSADKEAKASLASSLPLPSRGEYTPEFRYEVVGSMLLLGNQRLVSALHKVPYDTISRWKNTNWWAEAEEMIKHEKKVRLSGKLESIIEKSLEIVADRLEHGDHVLNNKTGQLIRKPVALKDASRAASELLTKKTVLDKHSEETQQTKVTVKETLALLASEFAKMARKEQKDKAETIEYVEVVPEPLSPPPEEPDDFEQYDPQYPAEYVDDFVPTEILQTPLTTAPQPKPLVNDEEPMANPPRKLRRR